jgi:hypothetical protein
VYHAYEQHEVLDEGGQLRAKVSAPGAQNTTCTKCASMLDSNTPGTALLATLPGGIVKGTDLIGSIGKQLQH